MPFFDMPLEQLQAYEPPRHEPPDFDSFWASTLQAARQHPLNPVFEKVNVGLPLVDVYDLTFSGYGGQRIKGWYLRPTGATQALPVIVRYIGYGGGRGFPHNWLTWPNAGYAVLVMDTRGQGSAWSQGDTPDLPDGANPALPGFMTQGVLMPETYYFRRLYTDAARAIEAARAREDVDSTRVAVHGGSQGGGLAVAAAGLVPDVAAVLADVPFLCHFRRAIGLTNAYPYQEISDYLATHRDQAEVVLHTLDYFDGMYFAARIQAPALFSVGLMDMTCPPSTVYAAYNSIPDTINKDIKVYRFNAHEGGGDHQVIEQLQFLHDLWGG